ncbi:MAG: hypothetical protein K2P78_09490 [Gemmataceae bacterium]|nr:hypothetical protein [Gemmataceae bacterium]
MRHLPAAFLCCCALAVVGCGGSNAPLSAPSYDADGMAKAALQEYDKNGNGSLEGAELDACPGLKYALAAVDTNKDKSISFEELQVRFREYEKSRVGAVSVSCTVRLNGKGLDGATVTFTPEEFMKGKVKGAAGTSDAAGNVNLTAEGGIPGLPIGVYKVTVSKKGADGSESVPAKYNAKTTLGFEVGPGGRGNPVAEFNLTSP